MPHPAFPDLPPFAHDRLVAIDQAGGRLAWDPDTGRTRDEREADDVLEALGYAEVPRYAEPGIPLERARVYQSPAIRITPDGRAYLAITRHATLSPWDRLDKMQKTLLLFARDHGKPPGTVSVKAVQSKHDVKYRAVRVAAEALRDAGYIKPTNRGYRLTRAGTAILPPSD